uniref:Putative transcription factor 25 n=1 Tax=Tabanus bromius TaxID=304241 RepID=A0A0K8TSD3_TABBR
MSSRVLKKLHGDNDFELKEQDEHHSDVEIELNTGTKKKQLNLNRYDLLNQQSPSESEVKEDDNETEHASAANNTSVYNLSKKKKKKRKKKSAKPSVQRRSSEDNADIEEIVRTEVDKIINKGCKTTLTVSTVSKTKSLLTIQSKHLNPQYEMRRTFGCKVVQAEQAKRRNVRGQRPLFKSTLLVTAKETWPPVMKNGIYMNVSTPPADAADPNNGIWFTFEHNKSYQQWQQTFLAAVESMDSENIIKIINRQPYHVDSLIQLSELCKMTENLSMASELIERALLAMETAFHSMFSLTSGNCRLDYRRQTNRSFFIALFKQAQYLECRACGRTALEIAKLILSFDPDNDPLAMVLVIDYYALRGKQYEWFVQFFEEWEPIKSLSQLPNMAYSYALALFYLQGDSEEANKALQYALLMFPGVLKPLLDELSIQTDSRVITHPYFSTSLSQSNALLQLVSLYVCRANNVWRDGEILPWLEKNVHVVMERADKKDPIISEYNVKRKQRYVFPPRPILRHIVLSDYKEKVPLATFIKELVLMYDPLPPEDSINSYERKPPAVDANTPVSSSSVSLFLQSILPSFSVSAEEANIFQMNRPPGIRLVEANANRDGAEAAGEEGAAATPDRTASLTTMVDAMRDFLSTIRLLERRNEGDAAEEEDESSEDESSEDGTTDYLT